METAASHSSQSNKRSFESKKNPINVSERERIISTLSGGALLLYGLRHFDSVKGKLAFLASASLLMRGTTGHCHIYEALDVNSAPLGQVEKKRFLDPHPFSIHESATVMRSLEECYLFCLDFSNIRRFIPHVQNIEEISQSHSRWIFTDKDQVVHISVEVDIAEDQIGKSISWRAFLVNKMNVTGTIHFKESLKQDQTEVLLQVDVNPPIGALGSTVMKAIGPFSHTLLGHTLHRFKQLIETGEIPSIDGQSSGHIKGKTFEELRHQWASKARLKAVQTFGERRSS